MNCPSCQQECTPGFSFCPKCETALERVLDGILQAETFHEYLAISH